MKALAALFAATLALFLGACASTQSGTPYQKDVMTRAKAHLDADKSVVVHEVYLDGEGGQIARFPVGSPEADALVADYFADPTDKGMISTGAFLVRRKGPDSQRSVVGENGRTDLPADYAFDYDAGQRWLALQEWCIYISPDDDGVGYGVFYRGGSSGGDPLYWSDSAAFVGERFQVPSRTGARALPQLPVYTEKQVLKALKKKGVSAKTSATTPDAYKQLRQYSKRTDAPLVARSFAQHKDMHASWVAEVEDPAAPFTIRAFRTLLKPFEIAALPIDYGMDKVSPIGWSQREAILESAEAGEAHRSALPF